MSDDDNFKGDPFASDADNFQGDPFAAPPRTNTIGEEAARQGGLAVRALASAAASPFVIGGDALGKGINAAAENLEAHPLYGSAVGKQRVQPYGRALQQTLSRMGLPEPERPIERFTQAVADTAPAAALPAGLVPQVVGNAAINAAQAPAGQEGTGAAWGAAGGAVGHGLSKVVGALTPTAEAEKLVKARVPLTYGQRLGPPVQSVENTLAKVPYVGAPIRARQQEALQGWQQATRDIPVQGAKTVDEVEKQLGARYQELLSTQPFKSQPEFVPAAIGQTVIDNIPGITGKMLASIETEIGEALSRAQSPRDYHRAVSNLKQLAHTYKSSPDPTHRLYGQGLSKATDEVNSTWRQMLPADTQAALAQVDHAWSQFVPIRSASTKYVQTLDAAENYTPRMLQQALRQRDASLGKTQFRETPQGQLAHQGETTIGSKSNAATSGSGILSMLAGGGAMLTGMTPQALAAAAAGAGYGTKAGQRLLIDSLPLQRAVVEALRRASPAMSRQMTPQDDPDQ